MRTLLWITLAVLPAACASQSPPADNSVYEMGRDKYGTIPDPDPARRISVQDCTRPIDVDGGNLYCK